MVVHAVRRAGDKRQEILTWLDSKRRSLVGPDHLRRGDTVGQDVSHRMQQDDVAFLELVDIVEHPEVPHAGVCREDRMRRCAPDRQTRAFKMSHACHQDRIGGAVIDRHADIDRGNLDPAHHGVVLIGELLAIGNDIVLGYRRRISGKHGIVALCLLEIPLLLVSRKRIDLGCDLRDRSANALAFEVIDHPRPHKKADTKKDHQSRDEPVCPARQSAPGSLLSLTFSQTISPSQRTGPAMRGLPEHE